MPYDDPSEYTPAYESFWEGACPGGHPSPKAAGWAFPLLFHTPGGHWGLITEAAVDGTYCGSRLGQQAEGGVYRLRFPDPGEGNGTGAVEPSGTLPWATPWRVVVIGTTPAPIVESTLVENLNPPSTVADTSWIKPGRASWSWLFDPPSPQDCTKLKALRGPGRRDGLGVHAGRCQLGHHEERHDPRRDRLRQVERGWRAPLVQLRRPAQRRHRAAPRPDGPAKDPPIRVRAAGQMGCQGRQDRLLPERQAERHGALPRDPQGCGRLQDHGELPRLHAARAAGREPIRT